MDRNELGFRIAMAVAILGVLLMLVSIIGQAVT